jgi:hypothetical protein
MVHEIYEVLLRTHQTPEQTPSQSAFSAFLPCPHNFIFEDSAGHNGPARVRKTNLSTLSSETMWYQPIFIEFLVVLFLLQEHMHFPSPTSRHFPLTTYLKSSSIHFHFTTRNGHKILSVKNRVYLNRVLPSKSGLKSRFKKVLRVSVMTAGLCPPPSLKNRTTSWFYFSCEVDFLPHCPIHISQSCALFTTEIKKFSFARI